MILIFGEKLCSGCEEAKKSFEADGIDYKFIDLNNMDRDEMALAAMAGAMTEGVMLPIIWDSEQNE